MYSHQSRLVAASNWKECIMPCCNLSVYLVPQGHIGRVSSPSLACLFPQMVIVPTHTQILHGTNLLTAGKDTQASSNTYNPVHEMSTPAMPTGLTNRTIPPGTNHESPSAASQLPVHSLHNTVKNTAASTALSVLTAPNVGMTFHPVCRYQNFVVSLFNDTLLADAMPTS